MIDEVIKVDRKAIQGVSLCNYVITIITVWRTDLRGVVAVFLETDSRKKIEVRNVIFI